jgi:Flp pilus assembly protein TadG
VETAIVMSLLLLLVLGMADFGRVLAAQISLKDAVSEGALYATQAPDDHTLVQQRVVDSADGLIVASDVTIACPDPKTVAVTATHDVDMITFVGQWFGASLTLSPSAVGTVIVSATCQPTP